MTVKLDGKSLNYFGIELLSPAVHPAAPLTRDITAQVPGRDGVYYFGSTLGERNFVLNCGLIRELSAKDLQRRLREFVAFLLDEKGRPRLLQISFDYEDGIYYEVRYSGQISAERFFSLGSFELTLTAFDPFAYADSTYKQDGVITGINYDEGRFYPADPNEITMDSTVYTVSDPVTFNEAYEPNYFYENPTAFTWSYSKHYSGVYNYSQYNTPLIIDITGDVINPRITNQTTGKTLYLPTITGGQKMTVDTGKFTVKVNGASKLTGVKGIEDFTLASGDNSLLFEGGLPSASVTFKWKHKFM